MGLSSVGTVTRSLVSSRLLVLLLVACVPFGGLPFIFKF